MTKLIYNARHTRVEAKEGRKVLGTLPTKLPAPVVEGILAAIDTEEQDHEALLALVAAALDEATRRKGSIVPDCYRHQYGVDQNCGDDVALRLTAKVTDPVTGVNLEACREVAAANGIEAKFDVWMERKLNPGMVRMNLGNVLRGKVRREEEILGLD